MIDKMWREFEIAVSEFLKAFGNGVTVIHDFKELDKQTKRPRQRDVMIETTVCGIIPIKILVSCKRYKRPLNETDIDHFKGEIDSSEAKIGVIYSYLGFNKYAVSKANEYGITCCCLYNDQPPQIPSHLIFPYAYACYSAIGLDVLEPYDNRWQLKKWGDVFSQEFSYENENHNILDIVDNEIKKRERYCLQNLSNSFPLPFTFEILLDNKLDDIVPLRLRVRFIWKYYIGKIEAFLLNGTFSFSTSEFLGNQSMPVIDTKGTNPGPGWELLDSMPEKPSGNYIVTILYSGDNQKTLKTIEEKQITFAI